MLFREMLIFALALFGQFVSLTSFFLLGSVFVFVLVSPPCCTCSGQPPLPPDAVGFRPRWAGKIGFPHEPPVKARALSSQQNYKIASQIHVHMMVQTSSTKLQLQVKWQQGSILGRIHLHRRSSSVFSLVSIGLHNLGCVEAEEELILLNTWSECVHQSVCRQQVSIQICKQYKHAVKEQGPQRSPDV